MENYIFSPDIRKPPARYTRIIEFDKDKLINNETFFIWGLFEYWKNTEL